MRTLLILALLASLMATGSTHAESPLVGTWAVDVTQLPMPPEARPKSVTFKFSESEDATMKIDVTIVGADGAEMRSNAVATLDGQPFPVTNSIEADVGAVKRPFPNVLVLVLAKAGVPGSTRIYSVDADGKKMIETATYFGPGGQPLMRTNYFSRVP